MGGVSVLVNNAAIAFKARDPTPFEGQTQPTLRTNVFSTNRMTETMLPLLQKGESSRIVFVASQAGTHALSGCSHELQKRWTDPALDIEGVYSLLGNFATSVAQKSHVENGWPSSNYGISKLAVIASCKA